jgi:hypothetical protein
MHTPLGMRWHSFEEDRRVRIETTDSDWQRQADQIASLLQFSLRRNISTN